ncbi:MAG: cysteine synthase [Solirubrobacteraceae bacterium]|jgi:cysteine synthase A|nr:cysteine synthase [Solirubrobacteraceae bacterium]
MIPVVASPSAVEALELPRIMRLGASVYGAAFSLMKLLPARFIIEEAERSGEIEPGCRVIETSSGTFGLGLAMICRSRGYDLSIVGDPVIDAVLRRRLRLLGADVTIVSGAAARGGVQQARLDRVERLCARHPRHFVPRQYDNPSNARAYGRVAELLQDTIGDVDCLVATVGSGGSSCGTASALREQFPQMRLIGVDTPGSVLFGTPDGPRLLRGLGSSIHPGNVDHRLFDEVHWLGAAEAFFMTRTLYRDHSLFMGPTSGAAYLVARWWAERNPGARVVAIMPDEGYRYERTVYDERWLSRVGALRTDPPAAPVDVEHPLAVRDGWSRLAWDRRSLVEVTGAAA